MDSLAQIITNPYFGKPEEWVNAANNPYAINALIIYGFFVIFFLLLVLLGFIMWKLTKTMDGIRESIHTDSKEGIRAITMMIEKQGDIKEELMRMTNLIDKNTLHLENVIKDRNHDLRV